MKRLLPLIILLCSTNDLGGLIANTTGIPIIKVVNFSQFSGPTFFSGGPLETGNLVGESITWTSTDSGAVIFGTDFTNGLNGNGKWFLSRNGFIGLKNSFTHMDFVFDQPVNSVGGVAG
ncbi:MAG: hypothetical protein R3F50_11400 [Gammaproteobacteria bacterium]